MYVNLEDTSAISVIDLRKHEVVGTHPIAPGDAPTGLALDEKNGLLISGCGNKKMVFVDLTSWKVAGSVEIGDHCDGVAFDPRSGTAFASCRDKSGAVRVKDGSTFEALAPLETPGGKTCALDPESHRLYITSGPPRGMKGAVKVLVFGP